MSFRLRHWLLLLVLAAPVVRCIAAGPFKLEPVTEAELNALVRLVPASGEEPERLVASVLAVTLGPFGAHRLYLGTTPVIPIVYGLTFGAFGVLVVIDLAHILFTKDLDTYRNSGKVLMWAKEKAKEPTPQ